MTINQILAWIKQNVSPAIIQALSDSGTTVFTEDLLAGICMREVGVSKLLPLLVAGNVPPGIWPLVKGDYSQRPGEAAPQYHGFGLWQIDIGSFPNFIASGDWQDPYKCCIQAIKILTGDMAFLQAHYPFQQIQNQDNLIQAVTAAYNCGAAQERNILNKGEGFDAATYQQNYSAQVAQFRALYLAL